MQITYQNGVQALIIIMEWYNAAFIKRYKYVNQEK